MQSQCNNQRSCNVSFGSNLVRPLSVSEYISDFFYSEGASSPKVEETPIRRKIVIVGPRESGKTTFVNAIKTHSFNENYVPTTQLDVSLHEIPSNKGKVLVSFFDSGATSLDALEKEKSLWRGACGFIVMFDFSKPDAFRKSLKWVKTISKQYTFEGESKCPPIALCANKVEKVDPPTDKEFEFYNKQNNQYSFFFTSFVQNYEIHAPLLFLLRKTLGEDTTFTLPEEELTVQKISKKRPKAPVQVKISNNPLPPPKVPKPPKVSKSKVKDRYLKIKRKFSSLSKPSMLSPIQEEQEQLVKPANFTPTVNYNMECSSPEASDKVKNKKTISFTSSNPSIKRSLTSFSKNLFSEM